MTSKSKTPSSSMRRSMDQLFDLTGKIGGLLRNRNKTLILLLGLALLMGCAAKDPNKVTPPKTIGPTDCHNPTGERVPCIEQKRT
jgi:hypothetical protein